MSKYVVQPFTKPSYDLSYFMNFSPDRLKAVALMAEVGLPLYKIHHSIVIGDVALLIADGVEKLEGVKVDRYVCEMGALLHDVGISQIQKDDMPRLPRSLSRKVLFMWETLLQQEHAMVRFVP